MPHLITVRPSHKLVNERKKIKPADLLGFPCCSPKMYPGIENCKQHEILAKFQIVPSVDFVFDSYITAAHRLKTSESWAYLPKIFADAFKLSQLKIDKLESEVCLKLLWPSTRPLPKAINIFFEKWMN